MFNVKDMNENYEVIKEICTKYRRELTIIGGVIGETTELITCEIYEEFISNISDEVFIGNYLGTLLNPGAIELYKRILNGADIVDTLCSLYPDDIKTKIREKIG